MESDFNDTYFDQDFDYDIYQALIDCGMMADGFCSFAGSEYCDWHCPLMDWFSADELEKL